MLVSYLLSFIVAFMISFFTTPLARKLAFKIGAVDIPKDERRMHKKPIPRLGGIAIVTGFFVSIGFILLSSLIENGSLTLDRRILGFFAGLVIIVILGIVDDIKELKAGIKFVIQIAAACCVAFTGTSIQEITNPFSVTGMTSLGVFSIPITVIWIVGVTNAMNFIDGLDGLAAGVASIASLSLLFISVFAGQSGAVVLTAALAGACLGFLPFNFNPAKIFMGDTGSTFLGFALGCISILGLIKSYAAIAIAVPLLVLGLPIFDTAFAIFRRIANGKSIMQADRGHLHHRLIDMGFSQRQTVIALYILSAFLGLCAIILMESGVWKAILLLFAVSIFVISGSKYITEMNDEFDSQQDNEETEVKQLPEKP